MYVVFSINLFLTLINGASAPSETLELIEWTLGSTFVNFEQHAIFSVFRDYYWLVMNSQ